MSNFYLQIYSDICCYDIFDTNIFRYSFMLKFSRISHSGLGALWAVQPTQILHRISPKSLIHVFPHLYPYYPPNILQISPRCPRFIHLNTYPRYIQDIHHISPRYQKDTSKIYPKDIPIDMMMRLSSGLFWGGRWCVTLSVM